MAKRSKSSTASGIMKGARGSAGRGSGMSGSQMGKFMVSTPIQDFKLTPMTNRLRARTDGKSRARVMTDELGRHTTETIESYIRYCMRMDNLQWARCLEDNRPLLVELFSMREPVGAGEAPAELQPDKTTADKARALRRRREENAAAASHAQMEERRAELLEEIRLREDFTREVVDMECSRVCEFILQYWRILRRFHKAGGELPVVPRMPEGADFRGEALYRTYVARLREDATACEDF